MSSKSTAPTKTDASPVVLTITDPTGSTREVTLAADKMVLGSADDAEVRVAADGIAPSHAMFRRKAGKLSVSDLGSELGTFRNGERLSGEVTLVDGDKLVIGGAQIVVSIAEPTMPDGHGTNGHAAAGGKAGKKNGAVVHVDVPERILSHRLPDADRPANAGRHVEVAMCWKDTLVDFKILKALRPITAGEGAGNDFIVANDLVGGEHVVIAGPQGNEFVITIPRGARLEVQRGADGKDVEELGQGTYTLRNDDYATLYAGSVEFVFRWVGNRKPIIGQLFENFDYIYAKFGALTALAHAMLLVALGVTPLDMRDISADIFDDANRLAKLVLTPQEQKKQEKKKFDLSGKKEGAKHKDAEGKFGRKDKPQEDKAASVKGAPVVDPNKREEDRKIALNSGLLGMLSKANGNVSNVFGPGGLGSGINESLGGLQGQAMGDAGGVGGLGTRGTGPGGGGNSLGIGGLGSGYGRGSGKGLGNIDLGGRGKGTTEVIPGKTIITGGLDKDIIGQVIRRHWAQVKYCYERELTKDPNLFGKIVVFFTIGGAGNVVEAFVKETSMGKPEIDDCILRVMQRLRFPAVPGGGTVDVTYPFIFKSA